MIAFPAFSLSSLHSVRGASAGATTPRHGIDPPLMIQDPALSLCVGCRLKRPSLAQWSTESLCHIHALKYFLPTVSSTPPPRSGATQPRSATTTTIKSAAFVQVIFQEEVQQGQLHPFRLAGRGWTIPRHGIWALIRPSCTFITSINTRENDFIFRYAPWVRRGIPLRCTQVSNARSTYLLRTPPVCVVASVWGRWRSSVVSK